MDIKFQDEPEKISLSKEDLKKLRNIRRYPRDEKFVNLFKRYLTQDGVILDDIIIHVHEIQAFCKDV